MRVLENTPLAFWLLVILMLFMLLVVVPWLIRHPPRDHDEQIFGYESVTIAPATA